MIEGQLDGEDTKELIAPFVLLVQSFFLKQKENNVSEQYNGFCNQETWAVNLYLNNNEYFYGQATEFRYNLAQYLENELFNWEHYFDEKRLNKHLLEMFFDIGDINKVDWEEVANNFLEDQEGDENEREV